MSLMGGTKRPSPFAATDASSIASAVAQLVRRASVELNVQDVKELPASRELLPHGTRLYVSHLPKQSWDDTVGACRAAKEAGFDPIPHIPVRLIESESHLDMLLAQIAQAQVAEILLISGDYPRAAGPYALVADVLRSGLLQRHGLRRVSFAGHPEGHPAVPLAEIRRAELEKAELAAQLGLEATFVTQFFFESAPFLQWASEARRRGIVSARLVAGLAGPVGLATLLKFAKRCGVGSSIRALTARAGAFTKLLGEYRPEELVGELAAAQAENPARFDGVHFFCFGGYLRTCEWLARLAAEPQPGEQGALE